MSTPRTKRSPIGMKQHAHTSKIPRPSWDSRAANHVAADTASPSLSNAVRGTKRRHKSEPRKGGLSEKRQNNTSSPPRAVLKPVESVNEQDRPRRRSSSTDVSQSNEKDVSSRAERYKRRSQSIEGAQNDDQGAGVENAARKAPTVQLSATEVKSPDNVSRTKQVRRTSGSKSQKSTRRSSFVLGRISKVAPIIQDVSLDVPTDLAPEERLTRLCSAVAEHTLNRLQDEMTDLDDVQQFQVKVRDAVNNVSEALRDSGAFKEATSTSRFLPNPTNEVLKCSLNYLPGYIEKLKVEFARWKELVTEGEEKLAEAERDVEDVDAATITARPSSGLTPQQITFLADRPHYNSLLQDLHTSREDSVLAVNDMLRVVSSLEHVQTTANSVYREKAQDLYKETFRDIELFHAPQALINAVVDFKDAEPFG